MNITESAKKKAIVAMSGGVDSSVAAYLLKKGGYEVIGLSFELWDKRDAKKFSTCCSVETVEIAKSVAYKLGIEHHTIDVRDAFYRYVIEDFCDSYIAGATPNPCILCNQHIKFEFLLQKAKESGADVIATGHYARTCGAGTSDKSRVLLKKGADSRKDQSYVLYVMTQEQLSKTVFPLGNMRKEETRVLAKEVGLESALRPESQEICFVGDGNYTDFMKDFAPEALKPGDILDMEGKIVGTHKGIAFYTIGQRKRLGVSSLKSLYVAYIDRVNNTITVGSRDDAVRKRLRVKDLNWIAVETLTETVSAGVKIRSTMKEEPATIIPQGDGTVMVEFDEPQWAPASGQSSLFYDGDTVIGGGVIE
ncbi:tRNA 2-thiouridine(34) synthase MnmA [Candidatus Woesearchaeota archaeon]|nr:tRNA 2-thiouridine(34) synthase MnmA [Candidatus Woesearchaeota archaeon]